MLKEAKNYSDKYDFLKPPPVTDNLRLSIISNEKDYAQNVTAVSSEGVFWDLKLSSALTNINIALQIDNLSSLPKDFNIWLLDKNRQIAIPLADDKFIINMNGDNKFLKLIVGTQKFADQNSENISLVPFDYALYQNYPNPFNPVTNISYYLREKSNVSVFIYDILGREIKSLITNEFQNAGEHSIVWNGTNILNNRAASGIYIYKIIANDFIYSKKMILLK